MRTIIFFCSILLLIPAFAPTAGAQDKAGKVPAAAAPAEPVHYYRLDFLVEQLDTAGKIVNTRSYSTSVRTGTRQNYMQIRSSSRIPMLVSDADTSGKMVNPTQIQHVTLEINIDANQVHEIGSSLTFDMTADLMGGVPSDSSTVHEPVIRQNRWNASVIVPIGKRTVVFTSDSLDSKGSTRVAVIATPIED